MLREFLPKCGMLLLLVCGWSAAAENEAKPVSLSAAQVSPFKDALIYMPEEQTEVDKISSPPLTVVTGAIVLDVVSTVIVNEIISAMKDPEDFPPRGKRMSAGGFGKINESMKSRAFVQSMNQIIEAALEGQTWFDGIRIYRPTVIPNKTRLPKLLKKPQWEGNLPDSAVILRNQFVFGLHYRLWFITDLEIYKVKALGKTRQAPVEVELLHEEKFASLYDLRDHFEIPNLESTKGKDMFEAKRFVNGLWNKDDGKLYFDTVEQLAIENAKMIRGLLSGQPPGNITYPADSAMIMAHYPIKPEAEDAGGAESERTPGQRYADEKRLVADGRAMEEMTPLQRKTYMLGKEYENVLPVNAIETTPERLIARDQNRNILFSLPTKNMKLISQNEIDMNEYTPMMLEYQELKKRMR